MSTSLRTKSIAGLLAIAALLFYMPSSLRAQGCNQVEIKYSEPDCFKRKGGGSVGNGTDCAAATVCIGQPTPYSALGGPWATYLWTVSGGPASPVISPSPASANVSITWPVAGTYTLTLTVTDGSGNTFTKCLTITATPKPVAGFTFSPASACAGSTVNFTNTTIFGGTAYYNWNLGDPASGASNTTNLTSPTHIFSTAGTYTVMLIAFSSVSIPGTGGGGSTGGGGHDSTSLVTCCADTFKQTVTVVNGTVKIDCISTVCAGAVAKYTAVGCVSPVWGAPVGGTTLSTSGNTITVQWGNGTTQGQLSVTCGGCTAYATVPIIPTTPAITGAATPCIPSSTAYSLPYLPGTDYTWTLMNVTASANETGRISTYPDNNTAVIDWTGTTAGDNYVLSVTLNNKHLCCTSNGSFPITPQNKFSLFAPSTICAGQSVSFFPSLPGTFGWVTTPGTGVTPPSATGASYTATFANAGNYAVVATSAPGAFCNATASANVKVVPVPVPGTISGTAVGCAGSTYPYSMTTPAPSGYYYEWTVSNGTFQPGALTLATGDAVNVLWTTLSGTLTVQLKQSASPFCIIPAGSKTVTAATVGAITGPKDVCVDGTTLDTLLGTLPPGTIINWTILPAAAGTVISLPGANPATILWHGQGGTGPWGPITLGATTGCGNATVLSPITVYPKFTISISPGGATDICQGTVTLTATGAPTGSAYVWSPFGQTTQTINVNSANNYTVVATKGGCSAAISKSIDTPLQAAPIACMLPHCTAGSAMQGSVGVQILKPAAGTFTYEWHAGQCTAYNPTILQTTTTTSTSNLYNTSTPGYYAALINYGSCQRCVTTLMPKICCPDTNGPVVTLDTQLSCSIWRFKATTANPYNSSIIWDFGDGTTDTGSSGTPKNHTYGPPGIYCVTFCVGPPTPNPTSCIGNCAITQATVPIAAGFAYTMGCNGCLNVTNNSVLFGNPSFVTYLWNFGDATTSNLQNPPQHCYALPGTYTVTLTMTYNDGTISCVKTDTKTVTYTKLAIAHAPVCSGTPVSFSSTPGGFVTYTWNFGDGITAYTSPIVHTYAAAGIYTVTLSVTDLLGNPCTATKLDTVLTGISGCTIQPGYICPGGTATLTAPAGTYTYLWEVETSPGVFAPAPGVNNAVSYTTAVPGNYHVILTNANGCTCISNKVSVTPVAKPKASFTMSPSKQLCSPGGFVTLVSPSITGHGYSWYENSNYGTLLNSGPVYGSHPFVTSSTSFQLIDTNQYGCADTCSQTVVVSPTPALPIITASDYCAGVPIILTVTNYPSNITWNNGAAGSSIVVYSAGTYVATVTNPTTGCSSSSSITINRRPAAGLFPHLCDSIPCKCTRPFTIYAPKPLIGLYASTYQISWYDAFTNVLLATGNSYNNGGLGVQTGSYYIIITDPATICKDTSNRYSVVVPPCDTCGCKNSHWGNIMMAPPGIEGVPSPTPTAINCKGTYNLECGKPYIINAAFICADTSCKGKVTYSLLPPTGPAITGNAPLTLMPSLGGTYTLTLYGWCGSKICDSCVIKFTAKCCECAGSKWNPIALTVVPPVPIRSAPPVVTAITCGSTYTLVCKTIYNINTSFVCKDTSCKSKVTYTLVPPGGAVVSGLVPFNFTPSLTGTYTLKLYGWCGDRICDSCVIKFNVTCPCDCNGSTWGAITLTQGLNDGGDPVAVVGGVPQPLVCNNSYNLNCYAPYNLTATYNCKDTNCKGKVTYKLQPPTGPATTGMMPLSFTPTLTGTYTLTLYGWCGDKLCDSCVIKFKVNCDCDCEKAKWDEKTYSDSLTTNTLGCNKEYLWKCKQPFTINGIYNCGKKGCAGTASYKLIPAVGAAITGSLPFTYTPTVSGTYTVVLYGYCGTKLCDSCVSSFIVTCVDTVCCKYDIKVTPGTLSYATAPSGAATIATQAFGITGLGAAMLSEVRAEVISYDISSNFNNECMACKAFPYLWGERKQRFSHRCGAGPYQSVWRRHNNRL